MEPESPRPVTVSLVNDFEVVVQGLARILEPYADRVRVVELKVGGVPEAPVDVALYDTFAAKHAPGTEFGKLLGSMSAGRLLVYSWHAGPGLVQAALAAGASGFVSKRVGAEELVDAIVRVAGGEVVVVGDGPEPVETPPGDWPGRHAGLSERESEVVALITEGLSNEQVADRAYLSINTIKSHIRTAYRKMGVETRAQAVLWAVDHGFREAARRERPDDDAL